MIYWKTNIQHIRKLHGLTPTQAAKLIGVGRSSHQSWERMGIRPQLDTLTKISKAYRISMHVLCFVDISQVSSIEELHQELPLFNACLHLLHL